MDDGRGLTNLEPEPSTRRYNCIYDASGNIGRRYRRMDEVCLFTHPYRVALIS